MNASHANLYLYAQAKAGGAAVRADLEAADVTPNGVALVEALLAPRQADRMGVEEALHRYQHWFSGAETEAAAETGSAEAAAAC